MGYMNPIIKFGLSSFMNECKESGIDGLIVPDLPFEEAGEYVKLARKNEIDPILLVAPNTPSDKIKKISKMSENLIYCVAILGITGDKRVETDELISYLKKVAEHSKCPFVVGFGIKDRSDVIRVNQMAHGAVVGSAIINKLKKSDMSAALIVKNYIEQLNA